MLRLSSRTQCRAPDAGCRMPDAAEMIGSEAAQRKSFALLVHLFFVADPIGAGIRHPASGICRFFEPFKRASAMSSRVGHSYTLVRILPRERIEKADRHPVLTLSHQ